HCSLRELCSLNSHAPHTSARYTLSLHDALPISLGSSLGLAVANWRIAWQVSELRQKRRCREECGWPLIEIACTCSCKSQCWVGGDRKSTRLNSSHGRI